MKKIVLLIAGLLLMNVTQANAMSVTGAYTGGSHFDQVDAGVSFSPELYMQTGLHARMTHEHVFKDPVYSVYVPVLLDFDYLKLNVRPFYYFKHSRDNAADTPESCAYGINVQLMMSMQDDTSNDVYTKAILGASFARQQGRLFTDDLPLGEDRYYSQAAFTFGFYQNFYQSFGLEALGTVFEYPDGVSDAIGFRGVMNQQDLASTQSFDLIHDLIKYTLGARFSRMWLEEGSTMYVSYRYGEYHAAQAEHSIVVGNTFVLFKQLAADLAYNHLRTVHNQNKRDIFYLRLTYSFE